MQGEIKHLTNSIHVYKQQVPEPIPFFSPRSFSFEGTVRDSFLKNQAQKLKLEVAEKKRTEETRDIHSNESLTPERALPAKGGSGQVAAVTYSESEGRNEVPVLLCPTLIRHFVDSGA